MKLRRAGLLVALAAWTVADLGYRLIAASIERAVARAFQETAGKAVSRPLAAPHGRTHPNGLTTRETAF